MPMNSEFPFGKGKGKKPSPKQRGEQNIKEAKERKEADERTQKIATSVEESILQTMGTPPDFKKIVAHPLWDDRFRVNVWNSKHICDSFFVHAVEDGITRSDPPIPEKKYEGAVSLLDQLGKRETLLCATEDLKEMQTNDETPDS